MPKNFSADSSEHRSEEHTSELQSLSLHYFLPICKPNSRLKSRSLTSNISPPSAQRCVCGCQRISPPTPANIDRKSTRLNSSHFPYTTFFRSVNQIAG